MKVLYLSNDYPRRRAPRWGVELIQAGPALSNETVEDRVITMATPRGAFDVGQLIARLPAEQSPDVIVCHPSAGFTPSNFKCFGGPTALLVEGVADAAAGSVLAKYATTEAFSRVVLVSDPQVAGHLRQAGANNLYWCPGFLFRFGDRQLDTSMASARSERVAVSMRLDDAPSDELALVAKLISSKLPVDLADPLLTDRLLHFGRSAAGLVTGETNTFSEQELLMMGTGTLMLTGLTSGSFSSDHRKSGVNCVEFRNEAQLLREVKAYLSDRSKLQAVATAGRSWFSEHCSDEPRRRAFRQIVMDGRAVAAFELPVTSNRVVASIAPGGKPADPGVIQVRSAIRRGDLATALNLAQTAPAAIWQRHMLMGEVALEAGNPELSARATQKALELAPTEPRLLIFQHLIQSRSIQPVVASRLVEDGWLAYGRREYRAAHALGTRALQLVAGSADAHHLMGMAFVEIAENDSPNDRAYHFGQALKHLNEAVQMAPTNSGFWRDLAATAARTGLTPESIESFQQTMQLGEVSDAIVFGLAHRLLVAGQLDEASRVLREGLMRSPENNLLQLWLGHCEKRRGHLHLALELHRSAVGADPMRPPLRERRRVVFLVQHAPMWTNSASVYEAFAADPAWETVLVALPYLIPTFQGKYDDSEGVFAFLTAKGLPFVRWKDFSLTPGFADVLFVENPYDYTRPSGWKVPDLLRLVPRLAYIPYALEVGGGIDNAKYQWNLSLQQVAWAVFARSEREKEFYNGHCLAGSEHVMVTGHPRMDAIRNLESSRDAELDQFVAGRKAILWNIHLDVKLSGSPSGTGYSTFLRWRNFIVDECAKRPELVLIIRPHPQLFSRLFLMGVMTQAQIDAYLTRCSALPNVTIDRRASYLGAFAASTAMISDASSFLLEYPGTGKPQLYLNNRYGPGLNADGAFVEQFCATAESEREIVAFLDQAMSGEDPQREARMKAYERFILMPSGGAGRNIKLSVEDRLNQEAADQAAMTTENCGLGGIADRGKDFWTHCESTHLAPEEYYTKAKRVLAERLPTLLSPDARVVDYGCGNGEMTLLAAANAAEVIGYDLGAKLIAQAREQARTQGIKNARFEVLDLEQGLPETDVDVVMCLGVSSCIRDDGVWSGIVAQIADSLKTGGLLVVRDTVQTRRSQTVQHAVGYCARYRLRNDYLDLISAAGFVQMESVPLFAYDNGLENCLWVFRREMKESVGVRKIEQRAELVGSANDGEAS